MKRYLYSLLFCLGAVTLAYSQAPPQFNYQAVARKADGTFLARTNVTVGIAILDGSPTGTSVFTESHTVTTNDYGLFNLQIGSKSTLNVNWGSGAKYISITVNGTSIGAAQLLSVPYALYSNTAGTVTTGGGTTGKKYIEGKGIFFDSTSTPGKIKITNTSVIDTSKLINLSTNPTLDGNYVLVYNAATKKWSVTSTSNTVQYKGRAGVLVSGNTITANFDNVTIDTTATGALQVKSVSATKITDSLALNKLEKDGATNGQVLKYNGTSWGPGPDNAVSSSGGIVVKVDELTIDTTQFGVLQVVDGGITSPKIADGAIIDSKLDSINLTKIKRTGAVKDDVLQWNGSAWVPAPISSSTGGRAVEVKSPITKGIGATADTIGVRKSDANNDGYLSKEDWTTFNNKIGIASPVAGDMIYHNGTDWVVLSKGNDGQVIKSNGGVPVWADDSLAFARLRKGLAKEGDIIKFSGGKWGLGQDQIGAAGGGIKKLNGDSVSVQTFTLDTLATQIGIVDDLAGTHTIGIPLAGNTKRQAGLLSRADYDKFSAVSTDTSKWNLNANGIDYTAGNVGIGTTLPTHLLDIAKSGTDNYVRIQAGGNGFTGIKYSGILLNEENLNTGWAIRMNALDDWMYFSRQDGTNFSNSITLKNTGAVIIDSLFKAPSSTNPRMVTVGQDGLLGSEPMPTGVGKTYGPSTTIAVGSTLTLDTMGVKDGSITKSKLAANAVDSTTIGGISLDDIQTKAKDGQVLKYKGGKWIAADTSKVGSGQWKDNANGIDFTNSTKGYVGIGTTLPTTDLHINGTNKSSLLLSGDRPRLYFADGVNDPLTKAVLGLDFNQAAFRLFKEPGMKQAGGQVLFAIDTNSRVYIYDSLQIVKFAGLKERMVTVDKNGVLTYKDLPTSGSFTPYAGKSGITVDNTNFDILADTSSPIWSAARIGVNPVDKTTILNNTTDLNKVLSWNGTAWVASAPTGGASQWVGTSSQIYFNNAGANNGKVGINNTTPTQELDVIGTVLADTIDGANIVKSTFVQGGNITSLDAITGERYTVNDSLVSLGLINTKNLRVTTGVQPVTGQILTAADNKGNVKWTTIAGATPYTRGTGVRNLTGNVINVANDSAIWNANKIINHGFDSSSIGKSTIRTLKYNSVKKEFFFDKDSTVGAASITTGAWKLTGNDTTNAATNFIGTIDDKPLVFKTKGLERLRLNGSAGNPKYAMEVTTYNEYTDAMIGVTNYGGGEPGIDLIRNNGQVGIPVAVTSGNYLGALRFFGSTSSGIKQGANITVTALENWANNTYGTGMEFFITGIGDNLIKHAITIHPSGNVGIGSPYDFSLTGSPKEQLDVNGGIRIGNTNGSNAGTIRFDNINGNIFQGYNGTKWVTFGSGTGGTPQNLSLASSAQADTIKISNGTSTAILPKVLPATAAAGQVLKFKGGKWVAGNDSSIYASGGGIKYKIGKGLTYTKSDSTLAAKSDSAMWNANKILGRTIDTTKITPTTNANSAFLKYDKISKTFVLDTNIKSNATAPSIKTFTSGSGTYTVSAGVKYIKVRILGGGGGGGASGASSGAGASGGNTVFGTSLLIATGGTGGVSGGGLAGIGGSGTINNPAIGYIIGGGSGQGGTSSIANVSGGMGGNSYFGGAGGGAAYVNTSANGSDASTNSGSGGGGAIATGGSPGAGGGAGGYLEATISSLATSYNYSIGAGGSGATSGTAFGGNGGSGIIIIEEYYDGGGSGSGGGGGGSGTVTSVATGTGLTGGPITGAGTISVADGGIGKTQLAANAVDSTKIGGISIDNIKTKAKTGQILKFNGTKWIAADTSKATSGTVYKTSKTIVAGGDTLVVKPNSLDSTHIADGKVGFSDLSKAGAKNGYALKFENGRWIPAPDSTGTGSGWALTGNALTPSSTNFIGTTDLNGLKLKTAGATRIAIDSSGNIGIGTVVSQSTARAKLEQHGTINNGTAAIFGGDAKGVSLIATSGASGIGFNQYYNGGSKSISTDFSGNISFLTATGDMTFGISDSKSLAANAATDGGTKMTFTKDGRLGIGTTPLSQIHIKGKFRSDSLKATDSRLLLARPNGTIDTLTNKAGVLTNNGSSFSWQPAGASFGWNLTGNAVLADSSNYIGSTNSVGISIRTGGTDRLHVSKDGNVGIGTASPTQKLHISGNSATAIGSLIENLNANGIAGFQVKGGAVNVVVFSDASATTDIGGVGTTTPHDFKIQAGNNTAIKISHLDSKVYIGTSGSTAPLSRLHVEGSIRSDSLKGSDSSFVGVGPNGMLVRRPLTASSNAWIVGGNTFTPALTIQQIGAKSKNTVQFITDNTARLTIGPAGEVSFKSDSYDIISTNYSLKIGATTAINANTSGFVGIGDIAEAGFALKVTGNTKIDGNTTITGLLTSSNITETSDARYKTNVVTIGNALATVQQLRGVSYDWKRKDFPEMNFKQGKDLGLIAQEVEKVLPELVNTDEKGFKSVQYSHLVSVLVEAIKEQQKQIETLKAEVSDKDSKVQNSENRIKTLESSVSTLNSQMQLLLELVGKTEGVKASK